MFTREFFCDAYFAPRYFPKTLAPPSIGDPPPIVRPDEPQPRISFDMNYDPTDFLAMEYENVLRLPMQYER